MCLTRAEAIAAADSALKGMAAVGTSGAFKQAAIDKAIEAAAMRKAFALCDSSRAATERQRLAANAGWEKEKKTSAGYKEEARRSSGWAWGASIVAILTTLLHFVK